MTSTPPWFDYVFSTSLSLGSSTTAYSSAHCQRNTGRSVSYATVQTNTQRRSFESDRRCRQIRWKPIDIQRRKQRTNVRILIIREIFLDDGLRSQWSALWCCGTADFRPARRPRHRTSRWLTEQRWRSQTTQLKYVNRFENSTCRRTGPPANI